ncbi:hypothetical protein D3C71_2175220 [compost metagenome]
MTWQSFSTRMQQLLRSLISGHGIDKTRYQDCNRDANKNTGTDLNAAMTHPLAQGCTL